VQEVGDEEEGCSCRQIPAVDRVSGKDECAVKDGENKLRSVRNDELVMNIALASKRISLWSQMPDR
jgi:hypothetical protein